MKDQLERKRPARTKTSRWTIPAEIPPLPDLPKNVTFDSASDRGLSHELLDRAVQGSAQAFFALIRPFERTLYLAAFACAGNQAGAEQIAQETMFVAFKSLTNFDRQGDLRTWLIKLTIRVSRSLFAGREESSEEVMEDKSWQPGGACFSKWAWNHLRESVSFGEDSFKLLGSALESAPRPYREILFLKDVLHLTTAQTAEALDLSEEAVRQRTSRARFALCDALAFKIVDRKNVGICLNQANAV